MCVNINKVYNFAFLKNKAWQYNYPSVTICKQGMAIQLIDTPTCGVCVCACACAGIHNCQRITVGVCIAEQVYLHIQFYEFEDTYGTAQFKVDT